MKIKQFQIIESGSDAEEASTIFILTEDGKLFVASFNLYYQITTAPLADITPAKLDESEQHSCD